MKKLTLIIMTVMLSSAAFCADQKAADFTLQSIDGEKFTLSERLEKGPVLIDFWATWCKPCKQALPEIDRIRIEYAERGLQVVTISTDNPRSMSKVKGYVKSSQYGFEVLLDTDEEVRKLFGGNNIPLTLLIETNGDIVYRQLGYTPGDEKELIQAIENLLTPDDENESPNEDDKTEGGDN